MNSELFDAARKRGCSRAEAELIAVYVVSEGIREAAEKIGIAESTAKTQADRLRRRLHAPHLAAAVSILLTTPRDDMDYKPTHSVDRTEQASYSAG